MSDNRRGFLKSMLTAGTALILPNKERKLVLPEDIHSQVVGNGQSPVVDLDDCVIIPKRCIQNMRWTVCHRNYELDVRDSPFDLAPEFTRSHIEIDLNIRADRLDISSNGPLHSFADPCQTQIGSLTVHEGGNVCHE